MKQNLPLNLTFLLICVRSSVLHAKMACLHLNCPNVEHRKSELNWLDVRVHLSTFLTGEKSSWRAEKARRLNGPHLSSSCVCGRVSVKVRCLWYIEHG